MYFLRKPWPGFSFSPRICFAHFHVTTGRGDHAARRGRRRRRGAPEAHEPRIRAERGLPGRVRGDRRGPSVPRGGRRRGRRHEVKNHSNSSPIICDVPRAAKSKWTRAPSRATSRERSTSDALGVIGVPDKPDDGKFKTTTTAATGFKPNDEGMRRINLFLNSHHHVSLHSHA